MESREEQPQILIAVCTYNESENITGMLAGLREYVPHADLYVVDDNSPDGTAALAQEWAEEFGRCVVHVRQEERGLGGAIRHAVKYTLHHRYELFVNLDADLSHSPAQVPELIQRVAEDDSVDVAIGSRYVDGGSIVGWPLHRKLMSRLVNSFATFVLRLPVQDCSGSMRCYRTSVLGRLDWAAFRNNGYALLEEVLVRLHVHGARMVEIPIQFTERQAGSSKLTKKEMLKSASAIIQLRRIR